MGCKPTTGEVRQMRQFPHQDVRYKVCSKTVLDYQKSPSMTTEGDPIVLVAERNRARVTAGPPWMAHA
jgi:hypothetical protein